MSPPLSNEAIDFLAGHQVHHIYRLSVFSPVYQQ